MDSPTRLDNAVTLEAWKQDELAAAREENLKLLAQIAEMKGTKEDKREPLPSITGGDCGQWVGQPVPVLPFVVADFIPQNMVSLLVADGGAGKSLMQQLAGTCVPAGLPFLGLETMAGRAAGVFAEDGEDVLHVRQDRINAALGVGMADIAGRWYPKSYLGHDATLWGPNKRGILGPTEFLMDLESDLSKVEDLKLLALDNASLLYAGPENERREVARFINHMNGASARLKVGSILSAHTSKSSDGSVAKSASGSTAWVNQSRSVLKLDAGDEDRGNPPTLTLLKGNHAKRGKPMLLEWQGSVLMPAKAPDSLEARIRTKRLDSLVFQAVHDGWERKFPASSNRQAGPHRYLPAIINRTSEFSTKEATAAMVTWIDNGFLQPGQRHTTKTPAGIKVAKWPDHIERRQG